MLVVCFLSLVSQAVLAESATEITWQIGRHPGHKITLKTEGKQAVLTSDRVNQPSSTRALDIAVAQRIMKDWKNIGYRPEPGKSQCGDVVIVSQKISSKITSETYCSSKMLESQRLRFKEFYEKLLVVSIDPKKKY